jgi:hypothetical protein
MTSVYIRDMTHMTSDLLDVLFSIELICVVSFVYCFLAVLSVNRPIYKTIEEVL